MLHSLQSTRVEMASHKIQTYQNNAKNLCTIYFVFDLDDECWGQAAGYQPRPQAGG